MDLAPTPPASFEGIATAGTAGTILWDYSNTYFTMPMLMAGGGYASQKVDGVYDGSMTGVNTDGAIAGAKVLKSLFDAGALPNGVDYGVMDGAMANGDLTNEFIENDLTTDAGLALWNAGGRVGALADISAAAAQADPLVGDMLAVAADGFPMPSNPEMGAFWSAMAPALTNITAVTTTRSDALNDAAARILAD